MSAFIVAIYENDATGQRTVKKSTVIYTDTELEARVEGAHYLGAPESAVTVRVIGGSGMVQNASEVYGDEMARHPGHIDLG